MPKTATFPTDKPGVRSYDTAAGTRYQADWRDHTGRRKSQGGFQTKRDAKRHKDRMEGAKVEGRSTELAKTTYNQWWAKWWPTHRTTLATGTIQDYENWHRLYIAPYLGDLRLVDIQPTDIKAMLAGLTERGLGHRVRQASKRLASQVLTAAIPETAGMFYNPASDIKVKKQQVEPKGAHALTPAQVEVIANASPEWLARCVRGIAYGGFRPSELCGLQRRHYSADTGIIRIEEVLRDPGGKVERRKSTKTYQTRRITIEVDVVADDLTERAKAMTPAAPMFPSRSGGELRTAVLRISLDAVIRKLMTGESPKLVGDNLPESITPYTLRHTCATMLARAGVPVTVAAKFMGHDPVEFLRTYADVFDADLGTAADAIAAAFTRATSIPQMRDGGSGDSGVCLAE